MKFYTKLLGFFCAFFMLTHTVNATVTITKDNETSIVIIEQTSAREIGYALQNNTLSNEERNMITSANGFVLSGPFANDPDLMQLAQKNNSIKILDMGDCNISPNNLMIPTEWKNTLEEFVIPTRNSFNKLPENFLYGFQKIKTIEIPENIKTIEAGALGNMTIHEITIPATLDRIKSQAFKETIILKDVYVESRNTICEMNAFDFNTLVGQTDLNSFYQHAATLHYPEADYEYFVGSWKEGKTIRQDNLNGFKDGFYLNGKKVGPNNGWQQFAMSDNAEPFAIVNNIIRTYSDNYEHDFLPTGDKYEIRVYRVIGYNSNNNVMVQRIYGSWWFNNNGNLINYNCAPANTGVILRAITKGTNYLHYFAKTNNYITTYPWKWNGNPNGYIPTQNNLLEKSVTPIPVAPVWRNETTNQIEFRNFGMKNGRWIRLTNSTSKANRAYLKMPASVFTNNNEGPGEGPGIESLAKTFNMGITITSNDDEDDSPEYIGIEFPEDEPTYEDGFQSEALFLVVNPYGNNGGIATNVSNVINKQDSNYYTLQGIRVKNPSKGVYIKNGKKVIVK